MVDYHQARERIPDRRKASADLARLIENQRCAELETDKKSQVAAKFQKEATTSTAAHVESLSPPERTLYMRIAHYPGKDQSWLLQYSHLPAKEFHRLLQGLKAKNLVRREEVPSTGGRKRKMYFVSGSC